VIDIRLIGGAEIAAKLESIPPKLHRALDEGLGRLALRAQASVREKLPGEVLKARSGKLRQSIEVDIGSGGDGAGFSLSSALPYAPVHEYGFSGTQNVRESLRTVKQAFGRPISPVQATVRAHSRKVNLPERSFLGSTLRELEQAGLVAAEAQNAIGKALA
jgi:phage gpG-like protein